MVLALSYLLGWWRIFSRAGYPGALAVLRHAPLYVTFPEEIEEAFGVYARATGRLLETEGSLEALREAIDSPRSAAVAVLEALDEYATARSLAASVEEKVLGVGATVEPDYGGHHEKAYFGRRAEVLDGWRSGERNWARSDYDVFGEWSVERRDVAHALGYDLPIAKQIVIVVASIIAGAGVAGIPEAGMIVLPLVLAAAGLPDQVILAAIPLIMTVDWIIARARSGVNVMSDMLVAILLDVGKTAPVAESPAELGR